MKLALGIDIGTSGIRTAVVDNSGDLLSMAQTKHLPQNPNFINAEKWWLAVESCIIQQIGLLEEKGFSGKDIARIAVDGTSGSMLLCDAELRSVGRALMYNSIGFEKEADLIDKHAPNPSHITQGSNSALARAIHLVSEDTDKRARHLLHQADFITAKLTGCGGQSDHNNSLKTGLDPATSTWPDWIDKVIDVGLLPKADAIGTPISEIKSDLANRLGLATDIVVCTGTTDSIAAFLAAATPKVGVAVTSLGSTLVVKMLIRKRIDDPKIGLYSHRMGQAWLVGGASNSGGGVLSHFFSTDEIVQLSSKIDTTKPTDLDYYPLVGIGERFPVNDPNLAPRIEPRPEDKIIFLQGLLEGIARIEAKCYQEIEKRGGGHPKKIFSAGGGAHNPSFTEIRSQILGIRPKCAKHVEAAIGVARLAAGISNLSDSLND